MAEEPVSILIEQAARLEEVRRYEDALKILARAQTLEPENAEIFETRANIYLTTKRYGEAIKNCEEAIRLQPDRERSHRLLALIYIGLEKKKPALAAANEAVRLDPRGAGALYALAGANRLNGKMKEAKQVAELLRSTHPDSVLPYSSLGLIALDQKDWKEAEQQWRKMLSIDPQSWTALNNLGLALNKLGKKKEAIEYLHRAAKIAPQEKIVRDNLHSHIKGYLGGGIFVAYFLLKSASIGARTGLGPILLLVCLVWIFFVIRGRVQKRSSLDPGLMNFYDDETRRNKWWRKLVRR